MLKFEKKKSVAKRLNSYPHVRRRTIETAVILSVCVLGSGRERVGKYSVNKPKAQTSSGAVQKHQLQATNPHAPKIIRAQFHQERWNTGRTALRISVCGLRD